jgi:GxGYxYP putative glycoside hydrolase C-terminal domain/GxGYxY sequence motif in domain of unknown function N-terminal
MRSRRPYRRYLAIAIALLLVVVAVRVVYVAQHHRPTATAPRPSPMIIAPGSPAPNTGPTTLYVINTTTAIKWLKTDPGEAITVRAMQGLVNRKSAPSIFVQVDSGSIHQQDWLNVLALKYRATVVTEPDAAQPIDELTWYIQKFRADFAGYVLFDNASSRTGGPSANLALSLAGVLNAIPIDRNDSSLIQAAKSAGLNQLDNVSNRDYAWLKASQYWSSFTRNAVYFNNPTGISDGGDFAVANRMPVFWDDVRNDHQMQTMSMMLSDQNPGGIVYGWGYTNVQYREDVFVAVASRYNQSLMDTPPNLSVYMHYPLQQPLKNTPTPPLPTDTHKHYVAFVYSDGDNPMVIFNDLTLPGGDRYESPLRGKFPVGWTLPPTIADLAGPVVNEIYATATPNDQFLAGPSGYGYAFPSLIPERQLFAAETQKAMARLGLRDVLVLDTDGKTGFNHSVVDPLTAQPNVQSVFFQAFNGRNQPGPGTVLWSNGKPVLPTVVLYRPPGQGNQPIAERFASTLNSLPRDATSPAGYTVVYLDFWSVSMTDLDQIVSRLNPNVVVVRPDVLAAMAQADIPH